MAAIASGIIFAWPSTAASIPSGFTRVTSLDARYLKGAANGVEPDATGGAATHAHTSPSHTHAQADHTHAGGTSGTSSADYTYMGSGAYDRIGAHSHTFPVSASTAASAGGTVATFNSGANDPAYVEVIFVQSDGAPTRIPTGMWALWAGGAVPTNWTHPAAGKNAFLKGAAAAGNGGGTGGGSHVHTAAAHTHVLTSHGHTSAATGTSGTLAADMNVTGTDSSIGHTHAPTYSTEAPTTGSGTSADTASTSAEPPWVKYGIVQQEASGDDLPVGVIAMWLGLRANIPVNWSEVTALRGNFIKGSNTLGETGTTGGAASHDHTDPATHTHSSGHTHTVTIPNDTSFVSGSASVSEGASQASVPHSHTATGGAASVTTTNGTAQTVDAATTEPPYRTVIFITFAGAVDVTVTEPSPATVGSPAFTVEWTNGGAYYTGPQADYLVEVFEDDQVTLIHSSTMLGGATLSYAVPGTIGLLNGNTYYVRVTTHDSLGVEGVSGFYAVATSWTPPPAPTGFTATPTGGV